MLGSLKASAVNSQATRPQSTVGSRKIPRGKLLSPVLLEALTKLAATEDLPVTALIAVLINEALEHRLHRRHV